MNLLNGDSWPFRPASTNRLAWILTAAVACIDIAWLLLGSWSVAWQGIATVAAVVTGAGCLLCIRRYGDDLRIRTTLQAATLMIVFTAAAGTLSYLVVSTNAPLVDPALAAWDRALGFDWLALDAWLRARPVVAAMFSIAYHSGLIQIAVVVLLLGFSGRHVELHGFVRLFVLATLISIVLSGVAPAAGAWKHYGLTEGHDLASLTHFELLRGGQWRHVPLDGMQGLISIPSMHAATAVLLVYAVRRVRLLLPLFVPLNAALLLATPVDGSHFLVDVLAGVALAGGLIALDGMHQASRSSRSVPDPAAQLEGARP